jgi:hypothetical protein
MKDKETDIRDKLHKQFNKIELVKLEAILFTNQTINIDGKPFKVPRCQICKKPMSPAVDKMNNKLSGYMWRCDCPTGKRYGLMIG